MNNFISRIPTEDDVPTCGSAVEALLASCNAALDDCAALTDADVKLIARALKDRLSEGYLAALETENAHHVNAIECLRQEKESDKNAYQACFELQQRQVEELVLALMWCKPRLKQEAYQRHIEWTLTKYPKPPKADGPPIVRSKNPDDDFCPSDPRGPGRTGGDGPLTTARLKELGKTAADSVNKNGRTG